MSICTVTGTIQLSDETPSVGVLIFAVPAMSPSITATGIAYDPNPVQAITSSTGYFELDLSRNMDFIVTINALGFREKIRTPDAATYSLFSITSVPIAPDATPDDTGAEEVNW